MSRWSLVYDGFDPDKEGLREALCTLGNGFFCTRGACEESVADGVHYPGTYLAGEYNRLKTEIGGHIVENEDLVNMPNWLPLCFKPESGTWFHVRQCDILEYRQELDMKRGMLLREIRFRDKRKRVTRVSTRRLVHMRFPHLAALEMTVIPENWSGKVTFRSGLDGRVTNSGVERYRALNGRHLDPLGTETFGGNGMYLSVQTTQSRLQLSTAARTRLFKNGRELTVESRNMEERDVIVQLFDLEIEEGMPVTAEKTVSLFSSRNPAIAEACRSAREEVKNAGSFDQLMQSHVLAWEELWRRFRISFKETEPDREERIGMILHLHTFHLLQSASPRWNELCIDCGIPSRGWHGEAYRGHIQWDEIFILPFLNLRMPEITKNALMYRYRRLDAARRLAGEAGLQGAMYPWQSGSDGREETQKIHLNPRSGRWLPDNSNLQRHVNAAVAFNICHYFQATHDMDFLSSYGAEIILEIARFMSSLATFNEETGRYDILGVMGPDEYHESYPDSEQPGLNNNAYTNVMTVWVLQHALDLLEFMPEDIVERLKENLVIKGRETEKWEDLTRKMTVPFHDDGIISQFKGYEDLEEFEWERYREKYGDIQRLDRILESENDTPNRYKASKQADVLMLFYLFSSEELSELFEKLGYPFEYETIPKNIDYYMKRTSHGSTLSTMVHAWVLGRRDRPRTWRYFNRALCSDVSDIQGGTTPEGIHLGAMVGTVDQVQRGYTGIVARGNVLWFNPCLPEELEELVFPIQYRGCLLHIRVNQKKLAVSVRRLGEASITLGCKEETREVSGLGTFEFDL